MNNKLLLTYSVTRSIYRSSKLSNSVKRSHYSSLASQCSIKNVGYKEIDVLKDRKDVLLIDVREPGELKQTGIIPGSINIPLRQVPCVLKDTPAGEFAKNYGRPKPSSDFQLVFSCNSGNRSYRASEIAVQLGYKNVCNYMGGWLDWEED